MATVTSVVTVDTTGTGFATTEWRYPDVYGVTHNVTNGETFSITIENTASNIKWQVLAEAPSLNTTEVSTTDGYKLRFRPLTDGSNVAHQLMIMALADAATSYRLAGELRIECPVSGIIQIWKPIDITISNVDMNAAGTLTSSTWEDQYGNVMKLPFSGSGITVGQAA